MNLRTLRSKLAALAVLFFLGTFAGQVQHLLDSVRGKVDRGAQLTGEIRSTVSTIGAAVDGALDGVDGATAALRDQVAELQAKLAAGTATPGQVVELRSLVERLKSVAGPPGPQGAAGSPGPPGPAAAPAGVSPSSTGPGGTTTSSRPAPAPTTTTTTTRPTTTTTRRPCDPLLGLLGRC